VTFGICTSLPCPCSIGILARLSPLAREILRCFVHGLESCIDWTHYRWEPNNDGPDSRCCNKAVATTWPGRYPRLVWIAPA
jgi:hypothetical protein